jgi:putative transposase
MLTPGQDHDLACAGPLLENTHSGAVIADKAYDADALIDKLTEQGVTPVIPPKANRKSKRECDFALYCERNLIERFLTRLSTSAALRRATTNWRETISRQFSWSPQSSCSTEDRL